LYYGKKELADKEWVHNTIDELHLATALILEQYRCLLTSYANIDRTVVKNFKIGNLTIYKGTQVLPYFSGPNCTEDCYENPEKFDIYRHTPEICRNLGSRDKLYPFSLGQRACPGRHAAMSCIKVGIMSYLEKFEIKATADPSKYEFDFGDTF
jgi:cytochrome P450